MHLQKLKLDKRKLRKRIYFIKQKNQFQKPKQFFTNKSTTIYSNGNLGQIMTFEQVSQEVWPLRAIKNK